MLIIDFSKPPEEDKNEPKPASFEPKRVIHRSKPLPHSGGANRQRASIFRRKSDSPPATDSQLQAAPVTSSPSSAATAKPEIPATRAGQAVFASNGKSTNPGLRLRNLLMGGNESPSSPVAGEPNQMSRREQIRRVYWNVSAGLSLIINVILLAVLLVMSNQIKTLKTTMNGLLSGLYSNFVEMDNASITTNITVDTQIPVNFLLPIQQDTTVRLNEAVLLNNAKVVINAGLFNINAPADITLPKDTLLPIALNLQIPVQTTVPLTLQVPVNIPLNQTLLHTPFVGLQNTVRPFYCTFDKNAQYPQGIYICDNHDLPTPTPGGP